MFINKNKVDIKCKKKYNNNVKVHNKRVYVDFKYNKF